MTNPYTQIPDDKVKQVLLLALIIILVSLICYNLAMFVPALLGAVTMYIICRKYNFYLQETRGWKSWQAAGGLILASVIILILPVYFIVELLIEKLGHASDYMAQLNAFLDQVHNFVYNKTGVDLLSRENMAKLKENAAKFSTGALSTTFNTLTIISSMYFILFFMLEKPRSFEQLLRNIAPFKRANIDLLGEKIKNMVIANAIGIPVVALGQGIVALVGYLIFGAPDALLLFVLTVIGSMIPIVGAAIVYVPVCIFMLASGDTGHALGLTAYCLIAVGLTDNLLRFTLLKKLENIHPLNTVFGIIMGMNLFGFMGLIFGPIMVSVTVLLIQVYQDEFSGDGAELILPETQPLEKKIDLTI